MGGAVYFAWPQPGGGEPVWQLLGSISNAKPSAIFRISRLKQSDENLSSTNSFLGQGRGRTNAVVGISVEPLITLQGLTPAAQTEAAKVSTFMEFGQKMVENLFNYASSFAVAGGEMRARSGETFVPFNSGTVTLREDYRMIQTFGGSESQLRCMVLCDIFIKKIFRIVNS